jgi:AI-2 transport protein TqsA
MLQSSALPSLQRVVLAAILVFLVIAGLYHGAKVLTPVAEAVFVWLVLNAAANAIARLPLVGRHLPRAAALGLVACAVLALGIYIAQSSLRTLAALGPQAAALPNALTPVTDWAAATLGVTQKDLLDRLFAAIGIETVLRQVVAGAMNLISQLGIVAIYILFLLLDQQFFEAKLSAAIADERRRQRVRDVLRRIADRIQAYLWVMTIASAATAVLSYAAMAGIGLDHAVFCATTIFFLNYIPTIGSILGTLLPTAFALLQFQRVEPAFTLLVAIGLIQFVIGNVLMPRLAGRTLNISLFVTVFSLFLWGAIWGVTGLFLAVPMTATLMIILGCMETTRPVAVLLSRDGRANADGETGGDVSRQS